MAGLLALAVIPLSAADTGPGIGYIAIVIDDLGYRLKEGRQSLELPPSVTLSFLPQTPHAIPLAEKAAERGHEIMLHLPMEARGGKRLGPGGLTTDMTRDELRATFIKDLDDLPAVAGVSNHMGSLLTARPSSMQWLMEAIQERQSLYFVDSRTTGGSVAARTAREHGIPNYTRDVFLDDDPSPEAIRHQLRRLAHIARTRGLALGIGHPYPTTLQVLPGWLTLLKEQGLRLIPVSRLIERDQNLKGTRLAVAGEEKEKPPPPPPAPTGVSCC